MCCLQRNYFPNSVITGPSFAHAPTVNSTHWNTWASVIAGNKTLPDIYSWHQIGTWEREPDRSVADFNTLLGLYGLPKKPIDLNEYAWTTEQNPANSAFYLAQLERHNVRGLRANWGSGGGLHDYLANLVYKSESDGEYHPNGEWHLYHYYANMTGDRVATTAAADRQVDVFATTARGEVKILAGARSPEAAYHVTVRGLSKLGFPGRGLIGVRTFRFDWDGQFADAGGPVDQGCSYYPIQSGQVWTTFELALRVDNENR